MSSLTISRLATRPILHILNLGPTKLFVTPMTVESEGFILAHVFVNGDLRGAIAIDFYGGLV